MNAPRPYNLVAELTYRCPLRCPYCSNPLAFRELKDGLGALDWTRVFGEAAELGVLHVGLTGGEPSLRADLDEIVAGATAAGLYTHLVTAGSALDQPALAALAGAGLRSVQLSLQDASAESSDAIAGAACFEAKLEVAQLVRRQGLSLTLNFVLHSRNLARVEQMIALARELDADRLELANTQYHGWALLNRDALLPTRTQLRDAARTVAKARRLAARPEIIFVLPDYWADRPKPCMGGWAQQTLVVAPDGTLLPCHMAAEIPGLEFWSVREHSVARCWREAPGMNAFRGTDWMPEPCRSCPKRDADFGGCRCQAFRLTGDPAATDPACELAPQHRLVLEARAAAEAGGASRDLVYRGARLDALAKHP